MAKHILIYLVTMSFIFPLKAQQLAYGKPTSVDLKTKMSALKMEIPSADIYDEWTNVGVHANVKNIPNNYNIDLRNFSMPIEHSMITSKFGPRWGRNHNGVDIKAYLGDTVRAAFDGKVRVVSTSQGGYGKCVVIRHWNGLETLYGHLSKQLVKNNQTVKAGEPIGLAGNTGRSTGTHLHFETRFCGIAINPMKMFSFGTRDVTNDFFVFKK